MSPAPGIRRAGHLPLAAWRFLRRFETRALVIFIAAATALWTFFEVADEVEEGETHALDQQIILFLREPGDLNDPIGPRSLEEAVRDITALGGTTLVVVATVVGLLLFLFHGRRKHALVLAGTVVLAWLSSDAMKAFYGRPRPELVPHGSYVYSASFPSGHSALAAATYLTLAILISSLEPKRRTKALVYGLALVFVFTVGLSRVYLGVHWPSDVVGGWCLGAVWALIAWIVLRRIGGRARG